MQNPHIVALTGGTGFIGSHLLKTLLDNGYFVRLLVRNPNNIAIPDHNTEIIPGDLHNQSALQNLCKDASTIIHCAGRVRGSSVADFNLDNIQGTKNVLDSLKYSENLKQFIFISSLAASQPNISDYAQSKKQSEVELANSHLKKWTIIRPPAVYGPGDNELLPLFNWIRRGILFRTGELQNRFSLLHVYDLSNLILSLLCSSSVCEQIIEPDDGAVNGYSWKDIRDLSSEYFQRNIHMIKVPAKLLTASAYLNITLSRILNTSPMLTPGKARELLHNNWVSDTTKPIPNWSPTIDLKTGLSTLYSS